MKDRWNRFWFSESSLARLAAFRIVVMALALYSAFELAPYIFGDALRVTTGTEIAFLDRPWNPIFGFELLGIGPPGLTTVRLAYAALLGSILLGMVGAFTRVACAVAAALTFYWIGLIYSYDQAHHERIAIMMAMIALPLAPCGARLSIDSLRARWRRARAGGDATWVPQTSPFAGWPLRFAQITIVIGYFFSGASKLAIVGPSWMNGYTLQGFMLGGGGPWSDFLAASVPLALACSVGTLGMQITSPLLLVRPGLMWFYLPALASFHLISWTTGIIGDTYFLLWMMFAVFLPLERVPAFLGGQLRSGPVLKRWGVAVLIAGIAAGILCIYFYMVPVYFALLLVPVLAAFALILTPGVRVDVVFDGACGLCRRSVAVLSALDWARRIRFLDLMDWETVHREHPSLDRERCLREMHIIDRAGRITAGFDGYRTISWRLPLFFWTSPILYIPAVAAIGRVVYRRVADARHRNGCNGACSLIDAPHHHSK